MTASFLVFVSDWLLRLFVLKVIFLLVVWQLLGWPLALGCFRRLWLCISLWTEPLELRHTMMPGGGVGSYFGDFIRSISAIRVQLRQF